MMRRAAAVLLILISATLALATASGSRWLQVPSKDHARSNPLAGKSSAIAAGALVYHEHCQQCHKANAQGDGHKRPSLHNEDIRAASDGDIEWFLRQGDLGHGMPSWSSLPEAQRWQLIAWLRSIQ